MYSRVTQLEIDTLRTDVEGAVELYRGEIVPRLREEEGYEGAYVLVTPEGKAVLITFWETEEQAAETPFYSDAIAEYVTLFSAPPGRETYQVKFADTPLVTV
jgi:hypothetical protein